MRGRRGAATQRLTVKEGLSVRIPLGVKHYFLYLCWLVLNPQCLKNWTIVENGVSIKLSFLCQYIMISKQEHLL